MFRKCGKCGSQLADGDKFCPECRRKRKSNLRKTLPRTYEIIEECRRKRKSALCKAVASFILTILLVSTLLTVKYLKRRSEVEALGELLVEKLNFPKGSIVVRHLDGDRYGVYILLYVNGKKMEPKGEPDFVMVADSKSRTFKFESDKDKEAALILSSLFHSSQK